MKLIQKILILVVIVLIIIGVVVYFVIIPTVMDISKINNLVINERKDLEIKYQRGQLLKKTIDDFEKIEPQKETLETIFLTQGDELTLITTLEQLASKNNLVQDIRIQRALPVVAIGNTIPLPLELTLSGGFFNILEYIHNLESLPYYFNISNIIIQGGSKTPGVDAPVSFTVSGNFFTTPIQ